MLPDSVSIAPGVVCVPRVSERARRISLRVRPDGTVELILPSERSWQEALTFLSVQKNWVLRTVAKARLKFKYYTEKEKRIAVFPLKLYFAFWETEYAVRYEWRDVPWLGARRDSEHAEIVITGRLPCPAAQLAEVLRDLLKREAERALTPMLSAVATELGFSYSQLTIRAQKGRWGSCSGRKNISLNAQLLFFPYAVVRYVMIHELAHTRQMNHGRAFWKIVETACPDWRVQRNALKAPRFIGKPG